MADDIPDEWVQLIAALNYLPTGNPAIDIDEWMTCQRDALAWLRGVAARVRADTANQIVAALDERCDDYYHSNGHDT